MPTDRTTKPRVHNAAPPYPPTRAIPKMGLGFHGTLYPTHTHSGNQYILVAVDYCTKLVGAKALRDNMAKSTAKLLYKIIWCRVGFPIELVSDQGKHFINEVISSLIQHYVVVHRCSTPYYP